MAAWFLVGAAALVAASALVHALKPGETALAYTSSALSFIAAFAAGAAAKRKRKSGALLPALVSAVAIIILALTVAFLISEGKFEPDGVLSLVSFTLSGSLAGAVFLPGGKSSSASRKFRLRKK